MTRNSNLMADNAADAEYRHTGRHPLCRKPTGGYTLRAEWVGRLAAGLHLVWEIYAES
jgi:hypothetical protein